MQEKSMQMREAIEEYRYAILDHARKTQALVTQRLYEFVSWCEGVGVAQLEVVKPTDVAKFLETARARRNPQTGNPLSSYPVHRYRAEGTCSLNWVAQQE